MIQATRRSSEDALQDGGRGPSRPGQSRQSSNRPGLDVRRPDPARGGDQGPHLAPPDVAAPTELDALEPAGRAPSRPIVDGREVDVGGGQDGLRLGQGDPVGGRRHRSVGLGASRVCRAPLGDLARRSARRRRRPPSSPPVVAAAAASPSFDVAVVAVRRLRRRPSPPMPRRSPPSSAAVDEPPRATSRGAPSWPSRSP